MHQKNNTNLDFGKTLKLLRVNRYTQKELAGKLHVSQQAVSRWERGSVLPEFSNLVKISELYNVSLKELIDTIPSASMPSDLPDKYEAWENARVQALKDARAETSGCTEHDSESSDLQEEHSETSGCEEKVSETSNHEEQHFKIPNSTEMQPEVSGCTDTVSDCTNTSSEAPDCTKEPLETSDCTKEQSDESEQKNAAFGTAFPKGKWYNFFYFVATGLILFSSIYLFYVGFPLCVCYFIFHRKLPIKSRLLDILAVVCLLINAYSLFIFLNHTIFDFGHSSITPLFIIVPQIKALIPVFYH